MQQLQKQQTPQIQEITVAAGKTTSLTLPIENTEFKINLGENSKLSILQIATPACIGKNVISLEKNAMLELGIVCLESSNVETQLNLNGQGASANIGAMFLGNHEENITINTIVNHVAPSTTSKTNIYGALKGKSRAKSLGNIKIEKTGQQANAFFASHALLLDKNCRAESIPALEIEANDVKAGHAASTTKISQEQLFYCESRGLSEKESEKIIALGFLQRAFSQLPFNTSEMVEEKWQKT
ncbi:MAG: SufD family Fe-S cluster assembly protein [Candidatus Micrarchaeota archaeon]|nr:SufD family Fe-S cluster assembly protein [Candidatus Micrarchaeota archaeon]